MKYKIEEYIQMYKNYKALLSQKAGQIVTYKENWSDDFCRKEINDCYESLMSEFKEMDFIKFTESELKELDFTPWDENLILMPIWAIDCLKTGLKVHSINGEEIIIREGDSLSKETRFGVTAYGLNKSQLRDSKLERILSEEVE